MYAHPSIAWELNPQSQWYCQMALCSSSMGKMSNMGSRKPSLCACEAITQFQGYALLTAFLAIHFAFHGYSTEDFHCVVCRFYLEILLYRLLYVNEGLNNSVEEFWISHRRVVLKWLVHDAVACQKIFVDSWFLRPVVSTNNSRLTRSSQVKSLTNPSFYSISQM